MLEKIVYPECICCGKVIEKSRSGLCDECFNSLVCNDFVSRCKYCSYPLSSGSNICGRCFKGDLKFDGGLFLFPYDECGKSLIHSIKFKDRIEYLEILNYFGKEIEVFLKNKDIEVVTYVPSSLYHYLLRGYTVPREIAKVISACYSIPFQKIVFTTKPFKRLLSKTKSVSDRKKIVKGFFRVKAEKKYKSLLLVDDVFTTGTTVNSISGLLKKKKIADKVYFLTLAMVLKN